MDATLDTPRFLDAGEAALVVEFGTIEDPAINDRVLALDGLLAEAPLPGIVETVPTYRSLMIHYDPLTLERAALVAHVTALRGRAAAARAPSRAWTLPACYDGPCGEDVAELGACLGLSAEAVVSAHAAAAFRVYMYGFAPGYAYLGGTPDALKISRRTTPRPPHFANALLLGGGLAGIATLAMPTGWYVVGRTPERLYSRERATPFFLAAGDTVRFERIDAHGYAALERRVEAGEIVAREVAS